MAIIHCDGPCNKFVDLDYENGQGFFDKQNTYYCDSCLESLSIEWTFAKAAQSPSYVRLHEISTNR